MQNSLSAASNHQAAPNSSTRWRPQKKKRSALQILSLCALWTLCWGGALLGLSSCSLLDELANLDTQGTTTPPTVTASALQLKSRPTITQLAAYYCPVVIDDVIVRLGCAAILGSPPPTSALTFVFGVNIQIHNPNNIPVPALDILLALRLFDGQATEALGAICMSMCGSADPTCDGSPKPGACQSSQSDIRNLDDFAARIPSLIADIVTGKAEQELRKSTIAAGGDVKLDLAFVLGLDQALRVFQKTALTYVMDMLSGRNASLSVPVSAEGSVFFNLPVVGRLGVGYGPLKTTWQIDSTLLN